MTAGLQFLTAATRGITIYLLTGYLSLALTGYHSLTHWLSLPDSHWLSLPDSHWLSLLHSHWLSLPDSHWLSLPDSLVVTPWPTGCHSLTHWLSLPGSRWLLLPDSLAVTPWLSLAVTPSSLLAVTPWLTGSHSLTLTGCNLLLTATGWHYGRRSVGQLVWCQVWCQAPPGARRPDLFTVRQLRFCRCGAPSLTWGRVCHFPQS
jgi:hypothetical protein